ncbi:hypothetical protein CO051_00810, partial [Candidatus Roizmanbacteria bacterium CG_4_9_14_0_2_um_filter_39_13]
MTNQSKFFNTITQYFVYGLVFLFPLFFVPITRDFLIYSKFYFLTLVLFGVLFISLGKFLLTKKFTWFRNLATQSLILILLSYILSIVLMSPNKLQAIYNPQYGLVLVASMVILYLYASHVFTKAKISPILPIAVSGVLVSVFALVIMVDPFQSGELPAYWSFLSNTTFNTIGSSIHFVAFLIFSLVGSSLYMWRTYSRSRSVDESNRTMLVILGTIVLFTLLALIFHIFIVSQLILTEGAQIIIPPLALSWYAAVEVLKNPMTAIFGVGIDNFSSLFTQVRTMNYNLSDLWQINSFNTSRSTFLHVFTEQGLLGVIGYGLLISLFLKNLKNVKLETAGMFITSILILFLLPPAGITFFLFFVSLAMMAADIHKRKEQEEYIIDLSTLTPIFIGIVVISALVLGGTGYFLGRNFMSELYFKKSLDAITENSLQNLYQNQAKALQYNNNNEEFHRQFAQTNLLVANNLASIEADKLTDTDRQTIADAIQAAIAEAKVATALNPQKVTNWQSLAGVYRQIINVAENAPVWAVSAYQQSISLDPRNPLLRLDLGGIYYLFENYDEAQKLFEQAVSLKPDWSNAHYNLAWTYY